MSRFMISLQIVMLDLPAGRGGGATWTALVTRRLTSCNIRPPTRLYMHYCIYSAINFIDGTLFPRASCIGGWAMGFSLRIVMKNNNNEANASVRMPPRLKEWSSWKRRCFIGLLCVLELAMIAAIIFGVVVLWSDLDLS